MYTLDLVNIKSIGSCKSFSELEWNEILNNFQSVISTTIDERLIRSVPSLEILPSLFTLRMSENLSRNNQQFSPP